MPKEPGARRKPERFASFVMTDTTYRVAVIPGDGIGREVVPAAQEALESAPDIAGQGIANPVAQILTGAMMLEHLGQADGAGALGA